VARTIEILARSKWLSKLAIIRCEDSGGPLIAISIDADHTLRWRQAAGLDAPPAVVAGRLSGYARMIVRFMASQ
jgi:hypothetical protein